MNSLIGHDLNKINNKEKILINLLSKNQVKIVYIFELHEYNVNILELSLRKLFC